MSIRAETLSTLDHSSSLEQPAQCKSFPIKYGLLAGSVLLLIIGSVAISMMVGQEPSSSVVGSFQADPNADVAGSVDGTASLGSIGQNVFVQEPVPAFLQGTAIEPLFIRARSFAVAHWKIVVPVMVLVCILVAVGVSLIVYFEQQRHAELAMQAVEERNQELMELERIQREREEQSKINNGGEQTLNSDGVVVVENGRFPWYGILGIVLGINLIGAAILGILALIDPSLSDTAIIRFILVFVLGHGWVSFFFLLTWCRNKLVEKFDDLGFGRLAGVISVPFLVIESLLMVLSTPFLWLISRVASGPDVSKLYGQLARSWKTAINGIVTGISSDTPV